MIHKRLCGAALTPAHYTKPTRSSAGGCGVSGSRSGILGVGLCFAAVQCLVFFFDFTKRAGMVFCYGSLGQWRTDDVQRDGFALPLWPSLPA